MEYTESKEIKGKNGLMEDYIPRNENFSRSEIKELITLCGRRVTP